MIISHKKRFILFLPWKTASQTMVARLAEFNESAYPAFFYFNKHLNRVVHQHMTCADFQSLPEHRLGYFTASFVRNPYDRAYSGFRQLQKDLTVQPTVQFPDKWVRELVMKQLSETESQLRAANYQFDAWIQLIQDDQIYEQGRNTNFPLHPAHYWTHVAGEKTVDFIGTVETFESDFRRFLRQVDLPDVPGLNANVVEPEARSAVGPAGYRYADRMNRASIDKINRLFEADFELFGYEKLHS
jgi:hypothetical protein